MGLEDKNRIYDGWIGLEGGVDAGRSPDMIDPNQCMEAINLTFRGGDAATRPGFRKLTESFPRRHYDPGNGQVWKTDQIWCFNEEVLYPPFDEVHHYIKGEYKAFGVPLTTQPPPIPPVDEIAPWFQDESSEDIYRNGVFQTACVYSPHNGPDCIIALIGGRLFRIIPGVETAKVTEIKITGKENDPEAPAVPDVTHRALRNMKDLPIAYMCQADKWLVGQDGVSSAIIYDGALARRSITDTDADHTEIPVGTIMAYGMGRLTVVVNERDVAFGDLYGSHDLEDPADSLIFFTERNFLAEGFDAAIPFQQGVATGAIFFPQLDTSTGNGQLMVFAERGAASFFLSLPREEWKTSQFQILSLLTTGLRGHRSIAVVNEDLWFRSDDGVRSYRQARSEPSGWAHIPLSTNVKQFLSNDSQQRLKFASSIYFDNRVIFTTSPLWNHGKPIHWGMVVVDFDILSSFSGNAQTPQASKPAWEGQWNAIHEETPAAAFPTQLLVGNFDGVSRAFMFCIDGTNHNQLYELSQIDRDDWDGQRINWELISRSFDFSKLSQDSTVFSENTLYDADIWLRDIVE